LFLFYSSILKPLFHNKIYFAILRILKLNRFLLDIIGGFHLLNTKKEVLAKLIGYFQSQQIKKIFIRAIALI